MVIQFMQDFITVVAFLAIVIALIAFVVEVYDRLKNPEENDQ